MLSCPMRPAARASRRNRSSAGIASQLRTQNLDRDGPLRVLPHRLVHVAHPTATDGTDDLVLARQDLRRSSASVRDRLAIHFVSPDALRAHAYERQTSASRLSERERRQFASVGSIVPDGRPKIKERREKEQE